MWGLLHGPPSAGDPCLLLRRHFSSLYRHLRLAHNWRLMNVLWWQAKHHLQGEEEYTNQEDKNSSKKQKLPKLSHISNYQTSQVRNSTNNFTTPPAEEMDHLLQRRWGTSCRGGALTYGTPASSPSQVPSCRRLWTARRRRRHRQQ